MRTIVKYFLSKTIRKFLVEIKNNYIKRFALKSHSQEGEDMILRRIFENKRRGFYVDVGAHHPFRFSNTYFFYKKDWYGINIDAMPNSMDGFKKFRPRDINIEIPIGNSEEILTYFSFNEPALNGFSESLSRERDGKNGYFIKQKIEMKVSKLSSVLEKYLPINTEIDFLSIDVEGLDFDILKSNDWLKYRPRCILVEIFSNSLNDIEGSEINNFLKQNGYFLFAKTVNTAFFMQQATQ